MSGKTATHIVHTLALSSHLLATQLANMAFYLFFFLNDPATTEISPLPLHDALPIWPRLPLDVGDQGVPRRQRLRQRPVGHRRVGSEWVVGLEVGPHHPRGGDALERVVGILQDRKSTRLNSSHLVISYAVFCLKKNKI